MNFLTAVLLFTVIPFSAFSMSLEDVDKRIGTLVLEDGSSPKEKSLKIDDFILILNNEIEKTPDNPNLFVRKAQVEYLKIYAYPIEKQLENESALRKEIFVKVNEYAEEALLLDNDIHPLSETSLLRLAGISSSRIIVIALQRYLIIATPTPLEEIERVGQLSMHLIREHRFNEAQELYQNLMLKYPERTWLKKTMSYMEDKRVEWEQAKKLEDEAIKSQSLIISDSAKEEPSDKSPTVSPKVNAVLKSGDEHVLVSIEEPGTDLWSILAAIIAILGVGGLLLRHRFKLKQ